jgi:hypothetical protein
MPFEKGQSGNRGGRPPDAYTAQAREQLRERCDPAAFLIRIMLGEPVQIGESLVYPNLDHMTGAAKKLLDKLIPDAKEPNVNLTIPTLTGPDSVLAAMNAVADRLANGAVTPTAANQVVAMLAQYSRAYETSVLEQRVADLERGRRKAPEAVDGAQ